MLKCILKGCGLAKYYIGTSGWHYDDWRGKFYPEKLPKNKWLEFYGRLFSTVELNNTFYRLPTEKAAKEWHDASPEDFFFAVKGQPVHYPYEKAQRRKSIDGPLYVENCPIKRKDRAPFVSTPGRL